MREIAYDSDKDQDILSDGLAAAGLAPAAVPQLINYQGRVAVGGTNFDGTGQFKFALVDGPGTTTFWSNDGTGTNGAAPASAVPLAVSKGLYAVLAGDTNLSNMIAVSSEVFINGDVRLRVWFSPDGTSFQQFSPDQRIATVGGGSGNSASGWYAAVPGGYLNWAAGTNSFAAGCRAKASHDGAFVWGDNYDADISSTTNDQFTARCSGG